MEFAPVIAMGLIIVKVIDFLGFLRVANTNGIVTQLASWIGSILVVLLVAQTDWADGIAVGDMNLGTIGFWSLIFFGLALGSGASFFGADVKNAIDNTTTAAKPGLVPLTVPAHRKDG